MSIVRLGSLLALASAVASEAPAGLVPAQTGSACSAVWDTATATASPAGSPKKPWSLACEDGDPTCDGDGLPNGACVISINACVVQALEGCTPEAVSDIRFGRAVARRVSGFVPPAAGSVPGCGTPGTLRLALKRVPRNPKKRLRRLGRSEPVKLAINRFTTPSGTGRNVLKVQCLPPAANCPPREPASLPTQITFTVPPPAVKPSDLDTGVTGIAHNQTVVTGAQTKYCLSECDGKSDTSCVLTGEVGPGTLNGDQFGAPLPLIAGLPVCVVNRYQAPIPGEEPFLRQEFDIATGRTIAVGTGVSLFSDVYVTADFREACPRCVVGGGGGTIGSVGQCSRTAATPGRACRVNSLARVEGGADGFRDYTLSTDCLPTGNPSQLDIRLPLTTETATATTGVGGQLAGPLPCRSVGQTEDDRCGAGTCDAACTGDACFALTDEPTPRCLDVKGGISQLCCSNDTTRPCFPTKAGGSIVRAGEPIVPGGPPGAFAALFCIPATDPSVNAVAGLPGPGALILPATAVVTPEQ